MDRDLVKILDYGVDSFTFEEALDYAGSHSGQIVTINPEMIEFARKNQNFSDTIDFKDMKIDAYSQIMMNYNKFIEYLWNWFITKEEN